MKEQQGITVFSSIHDMNIAMQYCDYIIAMKKGHIVSTGTPQEVLTEKLLSDLFSVRAQIIELGKGQRHIRYLGSLHGENLGMGL